MLNPQNTHTARIWPQRFRAPVIIWMAVASQNPERGIICASEDGQPRLYAWELSSGALRPVTSQHTAQGAISADGNWLYYLHSETGDGIGHYFRVPFTGGAGHDLSPELPPYISYHITEATSGAFYGFMAYNQYGYQMYVVDNISGGTPHLRYQTEALSIGPLLSHKGEITVIASTEKSQHGNFCLQAYDTFSGALLHELWDGDEASILPVGFATRDGDMRLLATSTRSGQSRPLVWNTRTGERSDLLLDDLAGEIDVWDWSDDGRYVLLAQLWQGHQTLYRYDMHDKQASPLRHPAGTFTGGHFGADGDLVLLGQDATQPTRIMALQADGQMQRTLLQDDDAPDGQPWRSVQFTSADGVPVQAWLAVPDGDGSHPTVIWAHDGPQVVMTERYLPAAQAWLDHGCAFCAVNYRGSTSSGDAFQTAIHQQPGRLECEDIGAAARWLVAEGVARADGLVLHGEGYGGSVALLAAGQQPELWAAVIAESAVADWAMQYTESSEAAQGRIRALFGGAPHEKPEEYQRASAIHLAHAVSAPLLIIQPEDDPRCSAQAMRRYLDALSQPAATHWFTLSSKTQQRIDHQARMMQFVYDQLQAAT